jgi:hypothetical protein
MRVNREQGVHTLAVTPARSIKNNIVLLMFLPICLFFRRVKPISADLRTSPRGPSGESQRVVSAK